MPDIEPKKHFAVSNMTLKEIAQSMLEVKKMARSIENAADAFLPLAESVEVLTQLQELADDGRHAAGIASKIYHLIAREAASA